MAAIAKSLKDGRKRGDVWKRVRQNWAAYVFISPFYISFSIFGLFGLLFAFYVSFHRWDGLTPMRTWGVQNYVELFGDQKFFKAIKTTAFLLAMDFPLKVGTPLVLAVMLNSKRLRGRGFFRTGYYLPEVTSSVVVTIVFGALYNRNSGIFNYVLSSVGLSPIAWLHDTFWAKMSLVILSGWWSQGYHMIIYLAGLQGIPQDIIEAAIVDGASRLQIFFKITMPLLRPMIIFTSLITVNAGLQRFAEPFLLTNGGPAYATQTMILYLYTKAFKSFRMGYSSAMGYVIFAMIFVFSLIQLKLGKED